MKILSFLARFHYCLGAMILASLAALVISIKYYHRHKGLNIFTWYILSSLLEDVASCYYFLYGMGTPNEKATRKIGGLANNFFMLAELLIFTYYLLQHIRSRKRKWIVRISTLLFFIFLIRVWTKFPDSLFTGFFTLESLFLVLPCLIYFYELFKDVHSAPLDNQPSFWIATGCLFLNTISFPLFLTIGLLGKYDQEAYTLNYILYTLLFLLIIRAYVCRPASPAPAAPN